MDVKELWQKIQNFIDPILAGIIVFLILTIASAVILLIVYRTEIPEHGLANATPMERAGIAKAEGDYVPYFIEMDAEEELPLEYEPVFHYNFFLPLYEPVEEGSERVTRPGPIAVIDDDDDEDPDREIILPPLTGVYLTGVINLPIGGGIAQLRTDESDFVFSVREGGYIPNTDIIVKKVLDNGVKIWKNGYRETFVTFDREENLKMLRE